MKKTLLFFGICLLSVAIYSQNCIDYIIYHIDNTEDKRLDTLVCKIMAEDELSYIVDNGFAITTISKKMIKEAIPCAREMDTYEVYKFKGIDNVTKDYFHNNNSTGNYLRKAAFNAYLSTGLGLAGAACIVLGTSVFNTYPSKNYWIGGGCVVSATSLFFIILAWNNVYKAGKLVDINSKAALFLSPGTDGNLGLSLKF